MTVRLTTGLAIRWPALLTLRSALPATQQTAGRVALSLLRIIAARIGSAALLSTLRRALSTTEQPTGLIASLVARLSAALLPATRLTTVGLTATSLTVRRSATLPGA